MPKLYACIISPDIKRDRNILVGVANGFASSIEVIEDGVLFDVSGLERLVGKPDRVARKIVGELKRRNVAGKVAVADTVDTAKLLARAAVCESPRASKGDTRTLEESPLLTRGLSQQEFSQQELSQPDMFAQLPLSGLDIERDTLNVFSELGLHSVADLQAVPHDDLIGRYGRSFRDVIDVIEQRGRSLITPNIRENKVSWSFELNNPVEDFEQLIFLLNHGLERLFAEVKYAGFSTEYLDLKFRLCKSPRVSEGDTSEATSRLCKSPRVSKGDTSNLRVSPLLTRGLLQTSPSKNYEIKTSFPTLDRAFWLKLINLRAALDPPEELIAAVDAVAYFTKPRTDQRGLYAVSRPEPESLLLTVGKLKKLVGEENVGVPVLVNQQLERPFALDADAIPNVTAGSSGVTNSRIFQAEQSPRTSASRSGTLAGEGACVPSNAIADITAATGCNAGASGVTNSRIFQAEQSPRTSASRRGTLAGEGACVPGNAIADVKAGNAAAPGCNAGSSGVTNSRIFQAEQSPRTSAPRSGTLAGEGACVAEPKRLFLVQIEKQASINRATEPTDSAIRDPQSAIFSIIGFNHFTPPLAAEVLARDGRLVYVRTRLFAGHVTNFSGVWKGNSHWWDKPWKTQEWDIEIENGGVYRLCRANDEWFLTGEYD